MLPPSGRVPIAIRAIRSVVIVSGLALLLAGCLKLDMAITISPDDTVDGQMVFAVNKQLLELTGENVDDMLGDTTVPSDVEGATQEPYEDGEFVGTQVTFENVALAELSEASDPDALRIVRTGDTYEVDGVMDLSTEDADLQGNPFEEQFTEAFDTAQLRIAITFPGEVLETNGQVDGTTVTWEPIFGERNVLTAVAPASGDGASGEGESDTEGGTAAADASGEESGGNALLYVIIGLVILGVVAGLFLMLRRRDTSGPDIAGSSGAAPLMPPPSPEPPAQTSRPPSTPPAASETPPPPPPVDTPEGGREGPA